jgi:Zn-dependent M28 family amino/carboxypeptidase
LIYVTSYSNNIIGFLEGNDPVLKNEVIVVGAHKDHLGDGLKYGSLYGKDEPAIHNGADDNASGTAGVLELAQKFAFRKDKLRRSYFFILFGAEEAGTIGSSYFTKSELFKSLNIICMLNMDMIGRVSDNKLVIHGTGTSSMWKSAIDSLNNLKEHLALTFKDEGYGPSDHSSFYSKDIPVLHFFTGIHPDYHKPTDDWELINAEGEVKVLELIADIITVLDNRETKPDFIKTKDDKQTMTGFKVTLGVVPDYASNVEGLQIMGVKEGGTAQKAGLVGGDVIIKLGPHNIKNIYDYTYALGQFKPGDETEVVVKRGDEVLTFKVTFTGK